MIALNFLSNIWFAPVFTILFIGYIKKYTSLASSSEMDILEDRDGGLIWFRYSDGRLQRAC